MNYPSFYCQCWVERRIPLPLSQRLLPSYNQDNNSLAQGGASRCQIFISTYRDRDIVGESSWLALWQAGIALNEMCVRRGFSGTASIMRTCSVNKGILV